MNKGWNTSEELIEHQRDWDGLFLHLRESKLISVPIDWLKYRNYDWTGEDDHIDPNHVTHIAAAMKRGDPLPPAAVVQISARRYDCIDGNHRVTAAVRLKMRHIPAILYVEKKKR